MISTYFLLKSYTGPGGVFGGPGGGLGDRVCLDPVCLDSVCLSMIFRAVEGPYKAPTRPYKAYKARIRPSICLTQ